MNNKFCANDVLTMFNSVVKDNGFYNVEQFCLSFLNLSDEQKEIVYHDVDFLGNNLIMDAIEHLKPDFALTLIDLGFNPNTPNFKGINPLINSIKYEQEDLALKLIDLTHDLDFARSTNGIKNGDTALIYAADHRMLSVVKKLIESGADPFYRNEFKQHALFYCLKKDDESLEVLDYLLGIYQEKSFIHGRAGSVPEILFRHGTIAHLNLLASHGLDFPDLSQDTINLLKNTNENSYSSKDANSYSQYIELINYWDKLKEMIKMSNKLNSKPSVKTKTVKI